ncbi:Chorismate mutase 2 [Platanthera zijinensis]|uniref:chorismate mutase n=1 Tax=Platanthera zijinensis TaxID=2320716 RepID=A0AAP0FW04_9ASPA
MAFIAESSLPLILVCFLSYNIYVLPSLCYSSSPPEFTLDSLRIALEKQEDFIIFSLIERARYPYNYPVYETSSMANRNRSFVEIYVRQTEAIESKFGRYQNPEELPFFPGDAHPQLAPPHRFPQLLYPPAASVNASQSIWDMYFNDLLPLFTKKGYDGNYQQTAASDLICLQALSKRINSGRFVAELKFRDEPKSYLPAIHAKDSESLMRLLTSTSVEEAVVRRVFEKAKIFGQDVNLQKNSTEAKVEPSVVSMLYQQWVIPLTKRVEVDYLLRHSY